MAYSSYGAFVFKDGGRRPDREDVGVFDADEADLPSEERIFANIGKAGGLYGGVGEDQPWHEHSHHAVLGDGPVRLAGYKYKPELWIRTDTGVERVSLAAFATKFAAEQVIYDTEENYGPATAWSGECRGAAFTAALDGEAFEYLDLTLTEPDGSRWSARCGHRLGARHEDEPARSVSGETSNEQHMTEG